MENTADVKAPGLTHDPLRTVQAYQLALAASQDGVVDARALGRDPVTSELASQLLRATASIAANSAEGYSTSSAADAAADARRFAP